MAVHSRMEARPPETEEESLRQHRVMTFRYLGLLTALQGAGTEVERNVTTRRSPDSLAYHDVHAEHTFVFPPQPDVVLQDRPEASTGEVPGTEPATVARERKFAAYDEDIVENRVTLVYKNPGHDRPEIHLIDEAGDPNDPSDLGAARQAVVQAFQVQPLDEFDPVAEFNKAKAFNQSARQAAENMFGFPQVPEGI